MITTMLVSTACFLCSAVSLYLYYQFLLHFTHISRHCYMLHLFQFEFQFHYRAFENPPVEMLSGTVPPQLSTEARSAVTSMTTSPPSLKTS